MGHVENQFSEGIALGTLMCGREGYSIAEKVAVELAFAHAWRSWPHRRQFPFVGSRTKADVLYQMTSAGERQHTHRLYWEHQQVQAHGEAPLDADEIAEGIGAGIPANDWRDLVQGMLNCMSSTQGE